MKATDDSAEQGDCGCSEYRELSRRDFVLDGGAGIAAAAAGAFFPAWLPRVVMAKSQASDRDVIVSVFLRGGIDGLTICVPWADPNYYASRTTIAIPRPDSSSTDRAIALDNFFGLPQGLGSPAGRTRPPRRPCRYPRHGHRSPLALRRLRPHPRRRPHRRRDRRRPRHEPRNRARRA
jgi:hypothetical protein